MQFSPVWPNVVIFIVILLLIACIVCVAVQDGGGSRPHQYTRTSPHDPWVPVREPQDVHRERIPAGHQVDVVVCSCGKWNAPNQSACWNCKTSLSGLNTQSFTFETTEPCVVCQYWVYPGESVVLCPSCRGQGHRAHMLEYLKAKGCCPVCNQKLNSNQLLNTFPKLRGSSSESVTTKTE